MTTGSEGFPDVEMPAGFADRVANAWVRSRRRRRWRTSVVLGLALVGALLVTVGLIPPAAPSGALAAAERSTVAIGTRAVVVAEQGARLTWAHNDQRWRVQQTEGAAFYRVDDGEPFVVETPQGTIEVEGTCFAVEVHNMKPSSKKLLTAAGLAGSVAAATVVSLYEGRVVIAATDASEAELRPGQVGTLVAGRPAMAVDRAERTEAGGLATGRRGPVAALRSQLELRRVEIEELEAEIERLDGGPEHGEGPQVGSDGWLEECAHSLSGESGACSYLEPSQAVLDEMARCGTLKVDTPPVAYSDGAAQPMADALGLRGEEAEAFVGVAQAFVVELEQEWVELALETGMERQAAEQLPWTSLQAMLYADLAGEEWLTITKQIGGERAGRHPVSTGDTPSLLERAIRLHVGAGERFERHVAAELGAERARELRAAQDGWSTDGMDTRFVMKGSCPMTDAK